MDASTGGGPTSHAASSSSRTASLPAGRPPLPLLRSPPRSRCRRRQRSRARGTPRHSRLTSLTNAAGATPHNTDAVVVSHAADAATPAAEPSPSAQAVTGRSGGGGAQPRRSVRVAGGGARASAAASQRPSATTARPMDSSGASAMVTRRRVVGGAGGLTLAAAAPRSPRRTPGSSLSAANVETVRAASGAPRRALSVSSAVGRPHPPPASPGHRPTVVWEKTSTSNARPRTRRTCPPTLLRRSVSARTTAPGYTTPSATPAPAARRGTTHVRDVERSGCGSAGLPMRERSRNSWRSTPGGWPTPSSSMSASLAGGPSEARPLVVVRRSSSSKAGRAAQAEPHDGGVHRPGGPSRGSRHCRAGRVWRRPTATPAGGSGKGMTAPGPWGTGATATAET